MVKVFTQAAPPPEEFLDVAIEGYYQLAVPANEAKGIEAKDHGDEYREQFRFLRHPPFSEVGGMIAAFGTNDDGNLRINSLNLIRFLLRAVHPEDRPRLAVLLDDQARVVTTEQITAVAMYLVEEYAGKASMKSDTSRPGPTPISTT